MEKLFQQLREVLSLAQAKEREFTQTTALLKEKISATDALDVALKTRSAELDEREHKVSEIESIVKFREETASLSKEVQKRQSSLDQEKTAFENHKNEENQKIADGKQLLKNREEQLGKDRAELEEEKKNFKAKIIEELSKNMR